MEIGEDDLGGVAREYFRVDDQGGKAGEVGIFRGGWNGQDTREILLKVRLDVGQADPADMFNNRDVIGRCDLPAMGETAFKAVVVRRVMAGRNDHTGVSTEVTDRKAQLRGGAGAGEEVSLAAQLGPRGGQQLREVAGKMPDIMGNHETRSGVLCGGLTPEAQAGAKDVEVIQASRADCGPDG